MKKILAATSFVLLSLCASPSYAKSLWLNCGEEVINLDTDKQQFYIETRGLFKGRNQGRASFFPNQISFEYQWYDNRRGGGLRLDYVINRKTLEYSRTHMRKDAWNLPSMYTSYKDWAPDNEGGIPATTTGVCKLIPNPSQRNKI